MVMSIVHLEMKRERSKTSRYPIAGKGPANLLDFINCSFASTFRHTLEESLEILSRRFGEFEHVEHSVHHPDYELFLRRFPPDPFQGALAKTLAHRRVAEERVPLSRQIA